MSSILQDLRYGCRLLLRNPGFSVLVIAVLALGIGATSAVFSVVNAVVLRPAPFREPGRLFGLSELNIRGEGRGIPQAAVREFEKRTDIVEKAAFWMPQPLNATGREGPENLYGVQVSADCFDLLGTPPALGRVFRKDEFRPGAPPAAILSDRLWQRRFGRDRGVIGREILLNGQAHTVVGVMPPDFALPSIAFELWTAWQLPRDAPGNYIWIVRLKPGVTPEQAQKQADAAFRIAPDHGGGEFRTALSPLGRQSAGPLGAMLTVFLGAVGFVLLIACMNVANLLLARGAGRGREIAVRSALGARRGRIVRQLLSESLLLAVLGGAAGLAVSAWASRALVAAFPEQILLPRLEQTRTDGAVLLFTLVLCAGAGIAFGLLPAFRISRANLGDALKAGERGATGAGPHRLRGLLVIAETALSLVLLAGAGLMLRTLDRMLRIDTGFNADRLLTLRVPLPEELKQQAEKEQYATRMLDRLRTLPGVNALGLTTILPLGDAESLYAFTVEGGPRPHQYPTANVRGVSGGYFRAMGIVLRGGRVFDETGSAGGRPEVVVSETLARHYFPNEDPVGRQIRLFSGSKPGNALTIIGVVNDVKYQAITSAGRPELYLDYRRHLDPGFSTTLVFRTSSGDPMRLATAVQKEIHAFNPDQPVRFLRTMRQVISDSMAAPRFCTLLLGSFAAIALLLAATGLYGILSYSVARRTHEIGIRIALGASRQAVARQVVGQALGLVGIGVTAGLAGAFALTRLIGAVLYQVQPTDPIAFGGASAVLLLVALTASYVPARRAMAVEPADALRCE